MRRNFLKFGFIFTPIIIFMGLILMEGAQAAAMSIFKYNRITCRTNPLAAITSIVKNEKHPRCWQAALQALSSPKTRAAVSKKLNNAPDYFLDEIVETLKLSLVFYAQKDPRKNALLDTLKQEMAQYVVGKQPIPANPTKGACQSSTKVVLEAMKHPVQSSECLEAAGEILTAYMNTGHDNGSPLVEEVRNLGAGAVERFVFLLGALLGHHQANFIDLLKEFNTYLTSQGAKHFEYYSGWACANNLQILLGGVMAPGAAPACWNGALKELDQGTRKDSFLVKELADYSMEQRQALREYLLVRLGKLHLSDSKIKAIRQAVLSIAQGKKVQVSLEALDLAGQPKAKSAKPDAHEELFIAGVGSISMTHGELSTLEARVKDVKMKQFIQQYFSHRVVVPVRLARQGGVFGALGALGGAKFWHHVGTGIWYSPASCSQSLYIALDAATVSQENQPKCLSTALAAIKNAKTPMGSKFKDLPQGLQNVVVSVLQLALANKGEGYPLESINQLRRQLHAYGI